MRIKGLQRWIIIVVLAVSCAGCHAAENNEQLGYARSLLTAAEKDAQLRLVNNLDHREAFRIRTENGKAVVEAVTEAGLIYGAQSVADGEFKLGQVEKPDFDIRGTTLCLMPHRYTATLSPKLYPWFYDKKFMARTLDSFAAARLNTIFLWAGHMFPYIVEMPDYPEAASDIPPEQVKANQEQFRWFTSECEKRNIQVLLHFYNIHVSPPFAKKHKMQTNPTTPTPLLKEYTHYALSRYFKEFASVGLYACPGESIHSKYQLEWFRDIIFDAAKKSGKNPVIVIRDWTQNMEFRDNIKNLYDNAYTEQKHNDESLTSPYPDVRIMQMEDIAAGHIVNFHLVTDLVPMRWGSPLMVQESMQNLKRLGFVKGVEFYGQTFWKWPYTLDKLEPDQKGYFPKGPKLASLDRDAIYFKAFGRYLWQSDRDPSKEQEYWAQYLAKKFGSHKVGQLLYQWYITSGPISPGLQNLNATKVAGWWPSVMLHNQSVDQILTYNKKLDETPYTLYRETGRAGQRFYPRPYDAFFFDRYRKTYSLPKPGKLPSMYKEFPPYKERFGNDQLEQRHCMPVSQYAKALEEGSPADQAMTPDKTAALLNTLAKESFELAGNAVQHANHSGLTDENRKELERFVTDSRMYVLATEALLHKEQAAILKARMLITSDSKLAGQFLKHMEQSVVSYQKLAELTTTTYLHGNDLMKTHWKDSGLKEFKNDLAAQKKWLKGFTPSTIAMPSLPTKPYIIGVAPSHITLSPKPLLESDAEWTTVARQVDLYKYYGVQLLKDAKWATQLDPGALVDFTKARSIKLGCEFGNFDFIKDGKDASEHAFRQLDPIFEAGGRVSSIHLDGPIRHMLKGHQESPNALSLNETAIRMVRFFKQIRRKYPNIRIGIITNFPNWDYTAELVGYNGHYTDRSGVTYSQALDVLHRVLTDADEKIDFVEVDCPYNYYREKRTRSGDADIDNAAKLTKLHQWCKQRDIGFNLIVNTEPRTEGAKGFHDMTCEYVRQLRRDGIFPDVFIVQSWYKQPARHLPETEKYTFMNTARDAITLIKKLF